MKTLTSLNIMKNYFYLFILFFALPVLASQNYEGVVLHGNQIAREFNFPTANIHDPKTSELERGVYVGTVDLDGKTYQTVFYAGPTREQSETPHRIEVLEAHLLDFEGDLYGKTLKATIHKMVRPDKDIPYKNWESFKEIMTKQVKEDLEAAKKILTPDSRR